MWLVLLETDLEGLRSVWSMIQRDYWIIWIKCPSISNGVDKLVLETDEKYFKDLILHQVLFTYTLSLLVYMCLFVLELGGFVLIASIHTAHVGSKDKEDSACSSVPLTYLASRVCPDCIWSSFLLKSFLLTSASFYPLVSIFKSVPCSFS